ncbi:Protein angel 2 [Rhizophlyctis rosea]|nr:Protein angel 2 [Rhizophlyctis rosea]
MTLGPVAEAAGRAAADGAIRRVPVEAEAAPEAVIFVVDPPLLGDLSPPRRVLGLGPSLAVIAPEAQETAVAGVGARGEILGIMVERNGIEMRVRALDLYKTTRRKHGDEVLEWSRRGPDIVRKILSVRPEVLCLQEVDENVYGDIERDLEGAGYRGRYSRCTGRKVDGVAVFLRTDCFRILESEAVSFPTYISNAAVVVVAQVVAAGLDHGLIGAEVVFATTHIVWAPNRTGAKMEQIMHFSERIHAKVVERQNMIGKRVPIVVCGDYNIIPYSPLHGFLRTGQMSALWNTQVWSGQEGITAPLRARFLWEAASQWEPALLPLLPSLVGGEAIPITLQVPYTNHRHRLRLESVYAPYVDPGTGEPYVTTYHDKGRELVDYIFFGKVEAPSAAAGGGGGGGGGVGGKNGVGDGGEAGKVKDGTVEGGAEGKGKGKGKEKGKDKDKEKEERDLNGRGPELRLLRYLKPPAGGDLDKMPHRTEPSDHVYIMGEFALVGREGGGGGGGGGREGLGVGRSAVGMDGADSRRDGRNGVRGGREGSGGGTGRDDPASEGDGVREDLEGVMNIDAGVSETEGGGGAKGGVWVWVGVGGAMGVGGEDERKSRSRVVVDEEGLGGAEGGSD